MIRDVLIAGRAVMAEFVRLNVLITGVVLSFLAVIFSKLVPPVDFRVLGLSAGLAAVLFCRTLLNGWLRDSRLRDLLIYPFSEKTLTLTSIGISTCIFLIEGLIPLSIFFSQIGYGSATNYGLLLLFSFCLEIAVLITTTLKSRYSLIAAYVGGIGLALIAGFGLLYLALSLAIVVIVAGAVFGLRLPQVRSAGKIKSFIFLRRNYYAVNAMSDIRVWSSLVLISAFAGFLSWSIAQEGLSPLIFLALTVVNTAQTTVLSRNPNTLEQIRLLGDERRSATELTAVNCVLFLLAAIAPLSVGVHFGVLGIGQLIFGVLLCLVAAAGSTWLEFKFPLRSVKSDRDALRHPRKYVVPLVVAALVVPFMVF